MERDCMWETANVSRMYMNEGRTNFALFFQNCYMRPFFGDVEILWGLFINLNLNINKRILMGLNNN